MKIFIIAWKDFLIRIRDRKGLLLTMLMPIILTVILGASLKGAFESPDIPHISVGIVNLDEGTSGKQLVEDAFASEFITLTNIESIEEVERAIKEESLDAGLYIPSNWTDTISNGKLEGLILFTDPEKTIEGSIVETIVDTYTNRSLLFFETTSSAVNLAAQSVPVMSGNLSIELFSDLIIKQLSEELQRERNFVMDEPIGDNSISAMQYYAAAMAAMFLLFNIMEGAKSLLHERNAQTLSRLMTTAISNREILIGKFCGTFLFSLVQFLVFIGATSLLFKVNWGENFYQTFLVAFSYTSAVAGLSMLMAAFVKSEKAADIIGSLGTQIFALLGGSMVPIAAFPSVLQRLSYVTPNSWALNGFIDIMEGAAWGELVLPIFVLLLIGGVSLMIGTWRMRVL